MQNIIITEADIIIIAETENIKMLTPIVLTYTSKLFLFL